MSQRTMVDNATINTSQIQKYLKYSLVFLKMHGKCFKKWRATMIVFVAGQKLNFQDEKSLHTLSGGGDESKK